MKKKKKIFLIVSLVLLLGVGAFEAQRYVSRKQASGVLKNSLANSQDQKAKAQAWATYRDSLKENASLFNFSTSKANMGKKEMCKVLEGGVEKAIDACINSNKDPDNGDRSEACDTMEQLLEAWKNLGCEANAYSIKTDSFKGSGSFYQQDQQQDQNYNLDNLDNRDSQYYRQFGN